MAEQPKVETEDYPSYRNEEAGVVMMSAAPQYWIWQNLDNTGGALRRLEGLLQLTTGQLKQESDALYPDMRPALAEVEKLVDQAPHAHRTALIWMYFLYTLRVPPEYRPLGAQAFVEKHSDEAAAAGPQTIAPNLIFNETGDWSIEVHQRALDDYFVQRARPSGLHAPRLLEAALCLDLAEKYRVSGATDEARICWPAPSRYSLITPRCVRRKLVLHRTSLSTGALSFCLNGRRMQERVSRLEPRHDTGVESLDLGAQCPLPGDGLKAAIGAS